MHLYILRKHDFMAKIQAQYFNYCKENLEKGEFVALCNFAANYGIVI
jgi:hypothetical protein